MISEIFSFLLSKPAIFFENLGVILKISGARAEKKQKTHDSRFHLWVGLLSVSWKFSTNLPPLRNFKKWRKGGGFVVIPPDSAKTARKTIKAF